MNRVKFTKNTEIGGYKLPADFPYITQEFLSSLTDLSFEQRVEKIVKAFSGVDLDSEAFSKIENAEFPATVVTLDESLAILELFDGNTLSYTDYIIGDTKELELLSLTAVIISAYVDLFSGGVIELGEKINFAVSGDDGRLLLSAYLAKLCGLFIDTIIVGTEKLQNTFIKGFYFNSPVGGEIDEIIEGLFEEAEYVVEPVSALALYAEDAFYSEYDDGNLTLATSIASPYLSARRVLKDIACINEISVDKAIYKLSMETALEIPSELLNKEIAPFFAINAPIGVKDAIEIINGTH